MTEALPGGDWFVLYHLGKHMDPLKYQQFVNELYEAGSSSRGN